MMREAWGSTSTMPLFTTTPSSRRMPITASEFLTLAAVPVSYMYFDDLRIGAAAWARRIFWRRR